MTDVPTSGPTGRLPRHVWVLLAVFILVVGFALGGSLRAAFASQPASAHVPAPAESIVPAATTAHRTGAPGARVAPVAPVARHDVVAAVRSASLRGSRLPGGSGQGERIVYQESTMHLWVVGADGTVVRDYPVTGRPGWPAPGTYHVFSKARATASPKYGVTFDWMVRFAHGHELNIGFHDIPRVMGTGRLIQAEAQLGAPIGHGGCVRQRTVDAEWLCDWAAVGTTVEVLA